MKKKFVVVGLLLVILSVPLMAEGQVEEILDSALEGAAAGMAATTPQLRVYVDDAIRFSGFSKAEITVDGRRYDLKNLSGDGVNIGPKYSAYQFVDAGSSHACTISMTHPQTGPETSSFTEEYTFEGGKKYTLYFNTKTGTAYFDVDS
ncbi:MAG: hypothetical protein LBG26_08625 [Treponema sp.]|jgi:hypothetical protein|nr:hypothetical protein [Treponema sp.]